MKAYFLGKKKDRKIIKLPSADFAYGVVKVNYEYKYDGIQFSLNYRYARFSMSKPIFLEKKKKKNIIKFSSAEFPRER